VLARIGIEGWMVFTAEAVEHAVATAYPDGERAAVRTLLSGYVPYAAFPAPQVQLAILALGQLSPPGERLAAVASGVQLANLDPRDVLAAAQWPEQVGAPHTRAAVRRAYRQLGFPHPPF
jgi:hypothetical protein